VPFLIVFDVNNTKDEDLNNLNEKFREKLKTVDNKIINTLYIDFERRLADISLGLDWLSEVMKAF